jgi:putative ABC transport system permease protein
MLPAGIRRLLRLRLSDRWLGQEIDDELNYHIEQRTARLLAAGMSPAEARREARRRFGAVAPIRDACADLTQSRQSRKRLMSFGESVVHDWTAAVRAVVRRPGLSAAVVAVLATGFAATASTLSIVDHLMLQLPPGVRDDAVSRLYIMQRNSAGGEDARPLLASQLEPLRLGVPGIEEFGAFGSSQMETGLGATADQIRVAGATPDFFRMLGARVTLGRWIEEADDVRPQGTQVAVLSHGYWQRRFGGDPAVVGQAIDLGRSPYTIIGVAEPGFRGLELEATDVWIPFATKATWLGGDGWQTANMGALWVWPVVKLHADASPVAVQDRTVAAYLSAMGAPVNDETRAIYRAVLHGLTPASNPVVSTEVRVALLLTGVAVLVLLIACTNAASLLLVRAAARRGEHAVRAALGASRSRIARLLLSESVLLALLAAVVSIPVIWHGRVWLQRLVLPQMADTAGFPEPRTIAGVFLLALAVAVTATLAPIATLRGGQLSPTMRDTRGAGRSRAQRTLLALQCAVSLVLLTGAGAFWLSLRHADRLDLGLARAELVAASVNMGGLGRSRAELDHLYATIVERLDATPGIRSATLATNLPLRLTYSGNGLWADGADSITGSVYFYGVRAGYFEVVGTPIVQGRGLSQADDSPGALPVTVINETLARRLWPDGSGVGRCIHPGAPDAPCLTVVGVARDAHRRRLQEEAGFQYYLPAQHASMPARQILVRTMGPAEQHVDVVRHVIQATEADLPFIRVAPLTSELEREMRPWRLGTGSFSAFAALAAVLAAFGLYAAVSYALRQRTRELGIRIALGAPGGAMVRLVIGDALRVSLVGCALGIAAALVLAPHVEPLLFETNPRSPLLLGLAALVVLAVSTLAVLAPALRVTRIDPTIAIRLE